MLSNTVSQKLPMSVVMVDAILNTDHALQGLLDHHCSCNNFWTEIEKECLFEWKQVNDYMKPEIQFHLDQIILFGKVSLFLNSTAEVESRDIFIIIWSYNVCDAHWKYQEADYLHDDSFLLFCYLVMLFKS